MKRKTFKLSIKKEFNYESSNSSFIKLIPDPTATLVTVTFTRG
jgi:hypothetical protein